MFFTKFKNLQSFKIFALEIIEYTKERESEQEIQIHIIIKIIKA
jgi:hypothetical protein